MKRKKVSVPFDKDERGPNGPYNVHGEGIAFNHVFGAPSTGRKQSRTELED